MFLYVEQFDLCRYIISVFFVLEESVSVVVISSYHIGVCMRLFWKYYGEKRR